MRLAVAVLMVALTSATTTTSTSSVVTTTTTTSTTFTTTSTTSTTTEEPNLPNPSIKTEDGRFIISLPVDSTASIRYFDDYGVTIEEHEIATKTEVDNLKSFFQDEVASLRALVNTKASQQNVDDLTAIVNQKAFASDVDAEIEDLSGEVDLKASQADFDILSDLVDTKASQSALDSLANVVDTKASNAALSSLTDVVNTKASDADLSSLSNVVDTKASQSALSNLADVVDTKASASSVDTLEALTVANWPAFEDFTSSNSDWTGNNVKRTSCGTLGNIMGGFNVGGKGVVFTKTYQLPIHTGVRIEFDYIFIDSWDTERAEVLIGNTVVWTHTHAWNSAISHKQLCGRTEFPEHVIHVDVTLWDHTESTLKLTIRSNINDVATDESFGFDNVYIHEAVPHWPSLQFFDGDVMGWSGAPSSSCGRYTILGKAGETKNGKTLSRRFQHLPSHFGVRVSFDVLFIDAWTSEKVIVKVDGVKYWEGGPQVTSLDMCGANAIDGMAQVDFTIQNHIAQSLEVTVSSTLASGTAKSFGITRFSLSEASPEWPEMETFETSDDTNFGWESNGQLTTTTCGSYGSILGGVNVLGTGRYLTKTFFNLPPHDDLRIQLDFLFLDSWDNERAIIEVDGLMQWQSSNIAGGTAHICGKGSSDAWKEQSQHVDLVIHNHKSSHVTIFISTTLDGAADDESFAIDNVLVSPATRTWPEMDTFETSTSGWVASGATTRTTSCGSYGNIFGGYNTFGSGAVARKTYTNLPVHEGLRIEMDFFYVDSWDSEDVIIQVDGVQQYRRRQSGGPVNVCGGGWEDEVEHLIIDIPDHTRDSVSVIISTTLSSAPNDESFAIDNVLLGHIVPRWPDVDDFEYSYAGWSGARATYCGISRILGGYNSAGRGARLRKTYYNLPDHSSLHIEFDYYFIDTWDNENAWLNVDGKRVWTYRYQNQNRNQHMCGRTNSDDVVEHMTVRVQGHVSSSAYLEFGSDLSSNPDDESFGIDNIKIIEA